MSNSRDPAKLFEEVLEKLEGVHRTSDVQAKAKCPAHPDEKASLSVKAGDKKVLLTCHADCQYDAIVAALGMRAPDLYYERETGEQREVAWYHYTDATDDQVLYEIVRLEPKAFFARQPDGTRSLEGIERVPYRLPELIKARDADRWLFLVEGEKDADTVCAAGMAGTTVPFGARGWRRSFAEWFADARVAVVPDNDRPGSRLVTDAVPDLLDVAAEVRVVRLPDGVGDVSDWSPDEGLAEGLASLLSATAPADELTPDDEYSAWLEANAPPRRLRPQSWMEAVGLFCEELPDKYLRVATQLAGFANTDGEAKVGSRRLSAAGRVSKSTLGGVVELLTATGWLDVDQGSGSRTNTYLLRFPARSASTTKEQTGTTSGDLVVLVGDLVVPALTGPQLDGNRSHQEVHPNEAPF